MLVKGKAGLMLWLVILDIKSRYSVVLRLLYTQDPPVTSWSFMAWA